LFNGGQAQLEMIESDDPLEAGLEIYAQPPGKALQSLSLLSGGEQTLTATALIFAMFLTNPSPICVLDEIDAPLDDSNVDRVCDLLEHMAKSGETRFLVITHHRMTMARMDRLYGVTMSEKGVSKLVSVDLSQEETLFDRLTA
jgi:chromosome segregation protein